MKVILLYWIFFILFCNAVIGQNNYSQTNFRTGQTIYNDISAAGVPIAMTDNISGSSATPQDIGFSFNFNGTAFTQFMIHADGILKLGTAAPGAATDIAISPANSHAAVFTSTLANFQTIIMPFFTNLVAGASTPVFHVLTTGDAPDRVCTIQWKNLRDADNDNGGTQHQFSNLEFQVKLYESTNDIEFIYGDFTPSATLVMARNAACGIKATNLSFFGLYRINSFLPFHKGVVLNPTEHGLINSSYAFRKTVIPGAGFSNRFFGRLANDINVGKVYYDSIAPLGSQTTGRLEALVVNEGTSAMNDISVSLNITGSNTHSDAVNIASIAAGASQRVSFPSYNLTNKGQQEVQVAITAAGDARVANNQKTIKQMISQSHNQTIDFSTNSSLGVGFNGINVISSVKMYGTGTRKIRQLRIPFSSYRNIVNVRIYEDGGAGGSPSGPALFTSTNFFTTFEHITIVPINEGVTVNGDYFIAVQQTSATNMQWRVNMNPPTRKDRYFNSGNNGVSWGPDVSNPPWELMAEAYEENQASDIGIERLTAPGCDYSTSTDVKVTLRNFSANSIDFGTTPTTITGFMRNPSGAEFPFTIQKNSGSLAPGAFEEVTVLGNYDYSIRGFHRINARTTLSGDVERGNDSLAFFLNNSIVITSSAKGPVCPLTTVTLTGVSYLGSPQWVVDGFVTSGTSPRIINPIQNTVVKFRGVDYRGCTLEDSIIVQVSADNLPPKPVLMFGNTVLSHRNEFKDTVRVNKLEGHNIQWFGGAGTPVSDSAYLINMIAGMDGAKVAAAYVRISDGCSNLSDTLKYSYVPGVLQNENSTIEVCDTSFYDAGGPVLPTGSTFTRSFTPSTPGTKVRLSIYRLDLAPNASLRIFDGPTTSSPRIAALFNTQNGNVVREFISSHESGVLTVQFTIGSFTSSGWWAGLTCYNPEVYRTVEGGAWITASTWERKAPGGNFKPANRPPTKGDDSIYIRHDVTLSSSTPMDQIVVEESGTLNIENPSVSFISIPSYKTVPQPEFLVKGTLNISPRVQVFGANGEMIIPGRLNNFGQIDLDSVVFNGTTPQTLGNFSGASGSMRLLRLDNPAGLTMGSDQTILGVRFIRGMLNTDSENLLTINDEGGFTSGARDEAHVNGPVAVNLPNGSGSRLYPIGSKGRYRPVILENSSGSEGSNESIIVSVQEGAPATRNLPPSLSKVSELRHYRITRTGTPGSSDFVITLPYLEDDGVTDPNNLSIAKDNGAGAWLDIGGTPSGSVPGIIQSNEFDNFSDFVLANKTDGNNPLPVVWLSFEANPLNADAHLSWRTSQERHCANYEIERGIDGNRFEKIGNQICRNTTLEQTYSYVDANPGKGIFYYRLRQVDNDGKFEYSPVRKVNFGSEGKITIYPNPARDRILISEIPGNSDIRLFDASGRLVMQTRNAQPFGQLQVGHLPAGIYQLSITTITGERIVEKVQIMK